MVCGCTLCGAGGVHASLDHAEPRELLASGYSDAADQDGAGFAATWPRRRRAPPVTLDHVLVDARAAVSEFRVFDVRGSDHRAVMARIRLPR